MMNTTTGNLSFVVAIVICSFLNLVICHKEMCPLWQYYSEVDESCKCCSGANSNTEIKCGTEYLLTAHSHCLTWNQAENDVEVARCLFTGQNTKASGKHGCYMYSISANVTGLNLNNFTCRPYNREGAQCRKCIDGYGPSPFSDGVTCADCSVHKHLWIFNLLFQLSMVTVLYLSVIVLQIKGTASPFNIIFTYSQLVANAIMFSAGFYSKLLCYTSHRFAISFVTVFGIFNLDFFRYAIPPLCVSTSLKSINIILFDYIVAVFPIVLTVLIYVAIELHDRNCCILVHLSSPIKQFWPRNWNPKETILSTFVTFLLLSYSKFLFVSLSLLLAIHIYNCDEESALEKNYNIIQSLLLYDPTIRLFCSEHIPYAILAFLVIVIFVILPPLFLLLYPTRLFRKCLSCCGFQRWDILQQIMDIFQGWYKDGTEGTYDFRSLSSLYMVTRVLFACSAYVVTLLDNIDISEYLCITIGILHILLGVLFLSEKPYKIRWMNFTDGVLLTVLGDCLITYFQRKKTLFAVVIFSLSPLLVASFCIAVRKFVHAVKRICTCII